MKTCLFILVFVFSESSSHAQQLFSKVFTTGDSTYQYPVRLIPDSAANSFLLLQNETGVYLNSIAELLYFDAAANLTWAKKFTSADSLGNSPSFSDMKQTDGGWLLSGFSGNKGALLKLDTVFNVKWYEKFELNTGDNHSPEMGFSQLLLTKKKLFTIGNYGRGHGVNRDSILVLSLKKDGTNPQMVNVEFYQNLGGSPQIKENYAVNIFQNTQGNYVLFTSSGSEGFQGLPGEAASPEITVLDTSFNLLFSKKLVLNYSADLVSCIQLHNGNYLLLGNGTQEVYLMELDPSLNVTWLKTYTHEVNTDTTQFISAQTVTETGNGFVVAGFKSFSQKQPAFMMKTDEEGNIIQSVTIPLDSTSLASVQAVLPWQNSILMASLISYPVPNYGNMVLFNADSNGIIQCNSQNESLIAVDDAVRTMEADTPVVSGVTDYAVESVTLHSGTAGFNIVNSCGMVSSTNDVKKESSSIKIYPQPASEILSVDVPAWEMKESPTISIYNSQGELMISGKMESNPATFSVSRFPGGIYLCKVEIGRKIAYSKFIVQRF